MDMLAYILPYMHTTCLLSSVLADIALLMYNSFIYMQQYITLFKSLIVYLYLFPPFFCKSLISHGYEKRSTFSQVAQRSCGKLDPWRYSKAVWTQSWATGSRWPCLRRGVGPDDLQRSFPTSNIL